MKIRKIPGGITTAKGFSAASCEAAIKYPNRKDMAMVFADVPCAAAGVFTSNKVKAAPVLWNMDIVKNGKPAQAVIVNTGIANAGTGETGMKICRETAAHTAGLLGISADSVLLGSTGVIGPNLPIERINAGISAMAKTLSASAEAGTDASIAIMTTDTVNKETAVEFDLPAASGEGTVTVRLGGMSKGSGMIHPNMCTMLAYLSTDCVIRRDLLQKALSEIVQETFNMISVDGDTSTNDTLLVLANGLAGNTPVSDGESEDYAVFYEALRTVCRELAMKMAGDGEGCTKLIETRVIHADTLENARILAKSVITSSLTKAAVFGKDANWGRILCALGYSGAQFDPENCDLYFGEGEDRILIFTDGSAADYSEEKATELLSGEKVVITADMHMGEAQATAWGCDLTYDYVSINADYRS